MIYILISARAIYRGRQKVAATALARPGPLMTEFMRARSQRPKLCSPLRNLAEIAVCCVLKTGARRLNLAELRF
jgi:hypothetical protein